MFCCILGSKKCTGGGGSAEIIKINLLRTWCVYIEGRISRKKCRTRSTYFELLSTQCMAVLKTLDQKQIGSALNLNPFYTVSYRKRFTVVLPK